MRSPSTHAGYPGSIASSLAARSSEFHLLDTGHFALEDKGEQIAALMHDFLDRKLPGRNDAR